MKTSIPPSKGATPEAGAEAGKPASPFADEKEGIHHLSRRFSRLLDEDPDPPPHPGREGFLDESLEDGDRGESQSIEKSKGPTVSGLRARSTPFPGEKTAEDTLPSPRTLVAPGGAVADSPPPDEEGEKPDSAPDTAAKGFPAGKKTVEPPPARPQAPVGQGELLAETAIDSPPPGKASKGKSASPDIEPIGTLREKAGLAGKSLETEKGQRPLSEEPGKEARPAFPPPPSFSRGRDSGPSRDDPSLRPASARPEPAPSKAVPPTSPDAPPGHGESEDEPDPFDRPALSSDLQKLSRFTRTLPGEARPEASPPPSSSPGVPEAVQEIVDRVLVTDPRFSGKEEVRIVLKDSVLEGTEIHIRREGERLHVELSTSSSDSLAFLADQKASLQNRLQERLGGEVQVDLKQSPSGQQDQERSRQRRSVLDEWKEE